MSLTSDPYYSLTGGTPTEVLRGDAEALRVRAGVLDGVVLELRAEIAAKEAASAAARARAEEFDAAASRLEA